MVSIFDVANLRPTFSQINLSVMSQKIRVCCHTGVWTMCLHIANQIFCFLTATGNCQPHSLTLPGRFQIPLQRGILEVSDLISELAPFNSKWSSATQISFWIPGLRWQPAKKPFFGICICNLNILVSTESSSVDTHTPYHHLWCLYDT